MNYKRLLKEWRGLKSLTQNEAAKKMNITTNEYADYESGNKEINTEMAECIENVVYFDVFG